MGNLPEFRHREHPRMGGDLFNTQLRIGEFIVRIIVFQPAKIRVLTPQGMWVCKIHGGCGAGALFKKGKYVRHFNLLVFHPFSGSQVNLSEQLT